MENEMTIRAVREEDAERLAEIYSYYVENTAVSFEYSAPTAEEFRERVRKISAKYPYLVCEKAGRIIGYVYAGRYSPRDAYNWTVTTSIYVDHECRRNGAGALLYRASVRFHEKEGYEQVAWMKGVGKKFDRWYDLLWMEKKINY